jgi:hypothetical protein
MILAGAIGLTFSLACAALVIFVFRLKKHSESPK